MAFHTGRYSKYIRPISILIDLTMISVLSFFIFFNELSPSNIWILIFYQIITWGIIAFSVKFYDVYRFTTPVAITSKIIKQGILFLLTVIAFFPFSRQAIFNESKIFLFIILVLLVVTVFKFAWFFYLKEYRIITGNNYRNAVIIGFTPEAISLKNLFETRKDYGYRFLGYFSDINADQSITGKLDALKPFVIENEVDEIYCSLNEVSNNSLKDLIDFADENNKTIKFIPDTKDIFSKNLKIDYYDFFPVLSLKQTILNEPAVKFMKRLFDILFSLIVIVFLLSWLIPLLAILIKLESKGPSIIVVHGGTREPSHVLINERRGTVDAGHHVRQLRAVAPSMPRGDDDHPCPCFVGQHAGGAAFGPVEVVADHAVLSAEQLAIFSDLWHGLDHQAPGIGYNHGAVSSFTRNIPGSYPAVSATSLVICGHELLDLLF